jgi:hypothetical protein
MFTSLSFVLILSSMFPDHIIPLYSLASNLSNSSIYTYGFPSGFLTEMYTRLICSSFREYNFKIPNFRVS